MSQSVAITFDCLPLRAVSRFDIPIDAPAELQELCKRVHVAADQHGTHNTYYLYNAQCVFHLTNDPQVGMLDFRFEGTLFTDASDLKTRGSDLSVELEGASCDWLTPAAVEWFGDTVARAVCVEFDRYIAAGDLERTKQRMQKIQEQSDSRGGFLGMEI